MQGRNGHLLILGGTTEAAVLAKAAYGRFNGRLSVTTSLAGRTAAPRAGMEKLRVGGFGGVEGLANWIRSEQVDMVIDATHPFASTISASARQACEATGSARLILTRPPWVAERGDQWRIVPDFNAAATALADFGSRVFLSVGSQRLADFAHVTGIHMVVRMIDPPSAPLLLQDYSLILGKGPFTQESETLLLRDGKIDAVVSRNSGGAATYAKIAAARNLDLPVIMIAPPQREAGAYTVDVEGALQWIAMELEKVAS